jgi:hypothetical protein
MELVDLHQQLRVQLITGLVVELAEDGTET